MDTVSSLFIVNHSKELYEIFLEEDEKQGKGALFFDSSMNDEKKVYVKYFPYKYINNEIKQSLEKNKQFKYKHILTSPKLEKKLKEPDEMLMILYNGDKQFIMNVKIEKYTDGDHIVFEYGSDIAEDLYKNGWKVFNPDFDKLLEKAIAQEDIYNTLRQNKNFTIIYQEPSKEYGKTVIEKLQLTENKMNNFKNFDDELGGIKYEFEIGEFSTGLLRYMNTYDDICKCLETYCNTNFNKLENIVEIGGGYGGLCKVIQTYQSNLNYTFLEQKQVNLIAQKYLKNIDGVCFEEHLVKYDICISEYGLCEFTDDKITEYVELLKKSSMCFLKVNIWNDKDKDIFKNKLHEIYTNVVELKETPETIYPDYILFCY